MSAQSAESEARPGAGSPPHGAPIARVDDATLLPLLAEWLPAQRWFAGDAAAASGMTMFRRERVFSDDALTLEWALLHAAADPPDTVYQLLIGWRSDVPSRVEHAIIGVVDDQICYDALYDRDVTELLLRALAGEIELGAITAHRAKDYVIDTGLHGLVMTAEQSNTSVVYGDRIIAKFFRHLTAGINPDAEVLAKLTHSGYTPDLVGEFRIVSEAGGRLPRRDEVPAAPSGAPSEQSGTVSAGGAGGARRDEVAGRRGAEPERTRDTVSEAGGRLPRRDEVPAAPSEQLGTVGTVASATTMTLAVATQYLANSADGWSMATASVRDLLAEGDLHADEVGGDFAGEANRLGQVIAHVHRDLADAFGVSVLADDDRAALFHRLALRAEQFAGSLPELASRIDGIRATYRRLAAAATADPLIFQRIHGDLHLGQVLRTVDGWVVVDFEGEPLREQSERRRLSSPLRDVAGMMRSFDYAAHQLQVSGGTDAQRAYRAAEWVARNRSAFLDGYATTSGSDPRDRPALLAAFELDKAIYEVRYEHGHRPGWEQIPLGAVDALIAPG